MTLVDDDDGFDDGVAGDVAGGVACDGGVDDDGGVGVVGVDDDLVTVVPRPGP